MASAHDAGPIRLVIILDKNTEPIEGELIEPSAYAQRFRGWLSLAALIESTRAHPDTVGDRTRE
jgi:hypothetical protein